MTALDLREGETRKGSKGMGEGNKRSDRRVNGERQLRRRRREEGERKGDKYRGKDMYEHRQTPHLSCHYTGSNKGIVIRITFIDIIVGKPKLLRKRRAHIR